MSNQLAYVKCTLKSTLKMIDIETPWVAHRCANQVQTKHTGWNKEVSFLLIKSLMVHSFIEKYQTYDSLRPPWKRSVSCRPVDWPPSHAKMWQPLYAYDKTPWLGHWPVVHPLALARGSWQVRLRWYPPKGIRDRPVRRWHGLAGWEWNVLDSCHLLLQSRWEVRR